MAHRLEGQSLYVMDVCPEIPRRPDRCSADRGAGGLLIRLARHGESSWNVAGRIQGQSDDPVLTPRGHDQARLLARQVAGRRVRRILSSDLRRATQTAELISRATGVPVVTDRRLRERAMGVLEGAPRHLATPALCGLSAGRVHAASARPPGGESLRDLHARAAAFLADRVAGDMADGVADGDTVIVAHGGTIRMLAAILTGTSLEAMAWEPVTNASIRDVAPEHPWNRSPVHCTGGAS